MKCACQGILNDSDPTKPAGYRYAPQCARKYLQDRLQDASIYTPSLIQSATDAMNTYNSDKQAAYDAFNALPAELQNPDILNWTLRVIEDEYILQWTSVATQMTKDWNDAYQFCCCAVKPYVDALRLSSFFLHFSSLLFLPSTFSLISSFFKHVVRCLDFYFEVHFQ